MNMWATVVECLLQVDRRNVLVAVDLENMFNAVDRDALVDELQRHPTLREIPVPSNTHSTHTARSRRPRDPRNGAYSGTSPNYSNIIIIIKNTLLHIWETFLHPLIASLESHESDD